MDGEIAILTFQNADRMNSFDPETLEQIQTTMMAALADPAVRGVVLTGEGRAFSTGADVSEFSRGIKEGTVQDWIRGATEHLHQLMIDMHASAKPIVAAVNGVAAGGGLGLALAADLRIGNAQARFAAGYFGIGASPDGGSTWFMPRLIGTQRTRRFFLENEVMDANEALRTGLMDELVDDGLLERAVELARKTGAWAPHSRKATKELLESALHASLEQQLHRERELIVEAGATKDFAEGVEAFLAKRKPAFSN